MELIQFLNTTPEQLKVSLINELKELLKPPAEEELLTQQEVAKLLKVSVGTVINMQKNGRISCYAIDNTIRYKKSEILNAMKKVEFKK